MPDRQELSARLAATLKDADSYEEFLDRLRLFGQESLFLIGTRILSGTVSAQQASMASPTSPRASCIPCTAW